MQRNNLQVAIAAPQNLEKARSLINEYILFYNEERCQNKLGDLSPVEFRGKIAA
ncbi:IS3 family transposase [Paenibacillus sp. JNUCC31]|uniref:IS3 family transposase n=1 Tax=Paenibacillus sp. JNUCC-31 TaxID=2777983 RepID=UPI0017805A90|nr:IS3 family transposase [Paenibacillus sp. JNUCC-31]QOS82558.1 IS3 family transposase [Paenibacillus sp. JNUCC-31]